MSAAAGQQHSPHTPSRHELACVPAGVPAGVPDRPPRLVAVAAAVDDAFASGDAAALAARYAPDARHRCGGVEVRGRDAVVGRIVGWRTGRAGVEVLPTRVVADERSVGWERLVLFAPTAPDAAPVEATCASLVVCDDDGLIVEHVDVWSDVRPIDAGFS